MTTSMLRPSKLTSSHLQQDAIVYIRQSTLQQVHHHHSSTQLQYQLRERLLAWGWSPPQIHVIDEDLGKSASGSQERSGFTRLVSMISMGEIGLLLGREASRLARSCSDWYRLLEICALCQTLIADADGIYDPATYNDRLLLGLKGTMSEAELHLLKQRMHAGRRHKAERGELRFGLPMGYVWSEDGRIEKDPDERARRSIARLFERFAALGTLNATLHSLVREQVQMPHRRRSSPGKGELEWRRPNRITLGNILRHPLYAGAYVYGRRQGTTRTTCSDPSQWQSLILDHHSGYISWQDYEHNVAQLDANRPAALGSPRQGAALLTGLLTCGRCGCRLQVSYQNARVWRYECRNESVNYAGPICQGLQGSLLEEWVETQLLAALEPEALEVSTQVVAKFEEQQRDLEIQWTLRLEQAAYEVERAWRQYNAVEPENRLVARVLEQRWNEAMLELKKLEREWEESKQERPSPMSEVERQQLLRLAQDLPELWRAKTTTIQERQQIARAMLEGIKVEVVGESERVNVLLTWGGGHQTQAVIRRPVARWAQLSYYDELLTQLDDWRSQGLARKEMLEHLNAHPHWYPPKRTRFFNTNSLATLLSHARIRSRQHEKPCNGQWTVSQLASELEMPVTTVYSWLKKGWVDAKRTDEEEQRGGWILNVNEEELERLRARRASRTNSTPEQRSFTTP